MPTFKRLLQILLLAASLVPAFAGAQTYPSRTVTIVVPFPPGGSNDTLARYLAEHLGKQWNQPVIVENRPGGGSAIGAAYVAKSPPDGHRMVLVSASYTTNAATKKSELGFDPLKDLVPASMVARGHVAVVTNAQLAVNSLADLARESRNRTVFYGTAGIGSSQHFNAELLNDAMGIKMTAVPYKGGQEALLDLAAGRIDIVVGTLGGVLGYINTGKAKPLAVLSKARSTVAPNVPTAAEQGFPRALTDNYFAVFVPAGTPDAVVNKINQGIHTVTHTPEGRAFLAKLDGEPTEFSPPEVSAYVKKEIEYWTGLARKLNLTEK